jgi:hypothetical protein
VCRFDFLRAAGRKEEQGRNDPRSRAAIGLGNSEEEEVEMRQERMKT